MGISDFFHTTLFLVLLSQSTTYLSDEYIGHVMDSSEVGDTPLFYYTPAYNLYRIISFAITIITFIICCFRFSWWLVIILPIVDFIASSFLAFIINITILKLFGEDLTRILAVIATIILDIILICMWF